MKLNKFLKYLSLGTVISSTLISLLREIDSEDAFDQHKLVQEAAIRINQRIANPPPSLGDDWTLSNPQDFPESKGNTSNPVTLIDRSDSDELFDRR